MEQPTTTYIALGSNQGDRFDYLQKAVDNIHKRIGQIEKGSKIYETPAWGYEGADFLNACLEVNTRFSKEIVLKKLLDIEKQHGRKRKSKIYQDRPLDLDILYYNDTICNTPHLNLPHPGIPKRRFVLQPLLDIAPDFLHPVLNLTNKQLLEQTEDNSALSVYSKTLTLPCIDFSGLSYLVIEGNIGAGKTSLANMTSQDFNAKLVTERYKDNPFLPKFYKNQARYAFPLEMSFLADRYQQLNDDIAQFDLFNDFIVSDYDIYKSMIFAGVTLSDEEFNLYKKLFYIMYKDMAKPNLYIYLYQNTERLLQNIKKRGRTYEQNIPADYLDNINRGYLDFIKGQNHLNTKIIDVNNLDFVANREDYLYILDQIKIHA